MQRLRNGMAAWLLAAALATSAFWFFLGPTDATAQSGGISNFDTVVVNQDAIVGDDVTVGGSLSVSGIIAASSYLTASGDLTTPGALTVTGNTKLGGTTDQVGALSDSNSALTVADNVLVDGAADAIQLTVQGHTAQTANPNIFVVENSGGTDALAVTAAGYVTITQDLKVSDDLTLVGTLAETPATTQTVTMNDSITADSSLVLLTSAGTVNTSNVACGVNGGLVTYVNVGSNSIVLTDTGTLKLSGNLTLGQYDGVILQSVWGNCIQLATFNN